MKILYREGDLKLMHNFKIYCGRRLVKEISTSSFRIETIGYVWFLGQPYRTVEYEYIQYHCVISFLGKILNKFGGKVIEKILKLYSPEVLVEMFVCLPFSNLTFTETKKMVKLFTKFISIEAKNKDRTTLLDRCKSINKEELTKYIGKKGNI